MAGLVLKQVCIVWLCSTPCALPLINKFCSICYYTYNKYMMTKDIKHTYLLVSSCTNELHLSLFGVSRPAIIWRCTQIANVFCRQLQASFHQYAVSDIVKMNKGQRAKCSTLQADQKDSARCFPYVLHRETPGKAAGAHAEETREANSSFNHNMKF